MNPDKCPHGGRVGAHRWSKDKSRDTRRCLDCGTVETLANPSMFNSNIYSADVSASMKKITDGFASTAENARFLADAARTATSAADYAAADYASMLERLGLSMGGTVDDWPSVEYDLPGPTTTTVSGNRLWTSEDALTLILEEIKHDPDPFAAAGKWLTRFTNGVTAITRNLDEED